jgi:hypothetical protein
VTREDFRRELGDAFDSISGSPSPALPDRVRSAVVEAPERRGPVWIAALAAAVIAVILVGVLLVTNPLNRGPFTPGGLAHASPTPCFPTCPAPAPTPAPSPSPNPSPTAPLEQFVCGGSSAFSGSQPPLSALIDRVQTGAHTGYDRLTIEFKNGQPMSIELKPQSGTTFTRSPRGDMVKLAGKDGLLITIRGADGHTDYSGSTDLKPGYSGIVEVREVQDFEGVVQWAMGLSRPACYKATILTNPTRLVIDIQTS